VHCSNDYDPIWCGGHAVERLSCSITLPNNICVAAPANQRPVTVCYAGQNPTFQIQRLWSWVYQQGTLSLIWYQETRLSIQHIRSVIVESLPGEYCL
jgi:hypothetical protein